MLRFVPLSLATLSLAAAAVCAAPAGATTYSGSGTDPAGDGPAPARDIAGVEAAYDDTGTVSASLTFGADPDPQFFYLQVGTLSGATCGPPFAALGGYTDATSGIWGLSGDADGDLQSDARIARAGSKVTITATSSRLSGGAPNCVTGQISTKDGQTLYDSVNTPAGLTAQAAPPPTTTTPAPAPPPAPATTPAPAPAPAPTQQTVAASKPKKVPQLAVTVAGVPSEIKRNRTMSLTVKVANTGTAAATGVTLKVGAARGLSATPKAITVKTLKAGTSATRRVKVTLTKKAKTTTTLTLKASGAKKVAATGRVALRIGKAKKTTKKSPPVTAPTKQNPLIGTYWWYVINHVDWAWDNHGVYFVNDQWAYRGIPKGGLPAACATQTAGVDEKGDATDGCIPYTYDPASGAVTLGTAAGTFKDGKLQIADEGDLQDYDRLVVPAAGARYGVELVHRGFQGLCGLILGCTTWENWLTLAADGQFIYSRSTLSTMGDPGIGPFTAAGSYPPDEHGTYEVQAGGKIRLAFADGTVKEHTFAIQTDKAGNPDPGGEGVFLDEDNFYKDEMP